MIVLWLTVTSLPIDRSLGGAGKGAGGPHVLVQQDSRWPQRAPCLGSPLCPQCLMTHSSTLG